MIAVSGIVSALAPNYKVLLASRCFLGMGIGGAQIFASWFLEFIPTSHRGSWMVAISSFWTLGTILEASLAWVHTLIISIFFCLLKPEFNQIFLQIVMPRLGWRWLLGFSSIPSLTVLVLLASGMVPESPRFLCTKGRITEAQRVLEIVALLNRTVVPNGVLLSDQISDLNERNAPPGEAVVSSAKKSKSYSKTYLKSLELFSSGLLKTTLLVWFLYFAFTFSYYGIVLITSELSSRRNDCGSVTTDSIGPNSNLYVNTFITSTAGSATLSKSLLFVYHHKL